MLKQLLGERRQLVTASETKKRAGARSEGARGRETQQQGATHSRLSDVSFRQPRAISLMSVTEVLFMSSPVRFVHPRPISLMSVTEDPCMSSDVRFVQPRPISLMSVTGQSLMLSAVSPRQPRPILLRFVMLPPSVSSLSSGQLRPITPTDACVSFSQCLGSRVMRGAA